MSTSECSSGCESGWTAYLEQSSNSVYDECRKKVKSVKVVLRKEDKDLSMVSDASSGPRHDENNQLEEDDDSLRYYSYSVSAPEQGKMKKHKNKIRKNQEGGKLTKNSHLDDTAASPVFSFSERNSLWKQHSGFLKSYVSGNEDSKISGDLEGTNH